MSWYTLEDAVDRGPSEQAWMHRVLAGEVSSYVDSFERRWLWIEEVKSPATGREVEEAVLPLGREVSSLRRELKGLRAKIAKRRSELVRTTALARAAASPAPPPAPPPAPRPAPKPAPVVHEPKSVVHDRPALTFVPAALAETRTREQVLDLVKARWTGSDRELEREASLPKAFLAKAKKGLRNGPRSAASWSRLEAFLRAA